MLIELQVAEVAADAASIHESPTLAASTTIGGVTGNLKIISSSFRSRFLIR